MCSCSEFQSRRDSRRNWVVWKVGHNRKKHHTYLPSNILLDRSVSTRRFLILQKAIKLLSGKNVDLFDVTVDFRLLFRGILLSGQMIWHFLLQVKIIHNCVSALLCAELFLNWFLFVIFWFHSILIGTGLFPLHKNVKNLTLYMWWTE